MKKEYETARLFRHNRESDYMIDEEELHDSDQKQSDEALNNSTETNETSDSSEDANNPSLPQRLLVFLQRAITLLGLDHKG